MKEDEMADHRGQMPDYLTERRTRAQTAESGGTWVVVYSYENGWKEIVTAEKPSVRNHNPGNVRYYDPTDSEDVKRRALERARNRDHALYIDKDGYGVYPDWLTGKHAADGVWERARAKGRTIKELARSYTKTEQEQRIGDLAKKAAGWLDRDGNPVNQDTPLSKLTQEQFITLRNYNNMQLEGWLNELQNAEREWIPPSEGTRQAPQSTPRSPANKPPVPAGPTKPRSSLEAPPTPYRPASLDMGTPPDQAQPMVARNKFLPPDMSQSFPTQFADPLAQYAGAGVSPVTENSYVPGQGGPARPNLLDSPSSFDSLFSGSGSQPQVIAQPSRQPSGTNQVPAGRVRKAPFYSLRDRLDFLGRVYRVAKPISEATGLSLPFVLAHAAHEVQFGKNVMENNLFNLKADKDWQGSTHLRGGTEYRSYPSYEESLKDYLGYLQADPRYGKMFEPVTRASVGRLADAIHYAGYSEDPLYGPRILGAAKDPIMKRALWQFRHWPPDHTAP